MKAKLFALLAFPIFASNLVNAQSMDYCVSHTGKGNALFYRYGSILYGYLGICSRGD